LTNCDDIASESGARSLIAAAIEEFGRVDIVVNNAGFVRTGGFSDTARADFERTIAVHVFGTWGVTQGAWPWMVRQRFGRVVITTSAAGLYGIATPPMAAYCAAKGAVYGLARAIAAEGEPHNIKANVLAPRAFTPLMAEHVGDPDQQKRLAAEQPPEAVAPTMAVLAHELCPVSGVVLFAGAGRVARPFMGESQGISIPPLHTPEDVLEQLPQILDLDGFTVPEPYVAPVGTR
jgi:NAD(P)-dependent dehydrogenase (short-subunit alcohol dehydrogenase family)